jgi:hypothetical protein
MGIQPAASIAVRELLGVIILDRHDLKVYPERLRVGGDDQSSIMTPANVNRPPRRVADSLITDD